LHQVVEAGVLERREEIEEIVGGRLLMGFRLV
jgi:hypothetical protein